MRQTCLIGLALAAALLGCGSNDTEVVVATLPTKAKPYPETLRGARAGAVPRRQFDARRLIGREVK